MRRAIYEDDVIKLLDKGWKLGVYPVASNIHALPSAQPEIIRCKDCKFYTNMRPDIDTGICSLASRHLGAEGFCSEAERKDDPTCTKDGCPINY